MSTDSQTTMQQLKAQMAKFVADREWEQFHTPKNLSMNLCREASELLEKFIWVDEANAASEFAQNRQEIEDEAADVLIALLAFANSAQIDLTRAFEHKLKEVAHKYPIAASKGRSTKYTKL